MKFVIDPDCVNIMKKICNFGLNRVCTKEEIESLMTFTYLKCKKLYDPKKHNAKFTSYLYQSFLNNSRTLYKKKSRNLERNINPEFIAIHEDDHELFFILESLKEKDSCLYCLLVQKYIYNMTNAEIANLSGCTSENVRKKVKRALEMCREIVYN